MKQSWEIVYYSERVRKTIDGWPVGIRAFYARIADRMKISGPHIGMPFTRAMGEGLFEIRAIGREGLGRVFFCATVKSKIVILHGFIKKSGKTPSRELKTARRRLAEVLDET